MLGAERGERPGVEYIGFSMSGIFWILENVSFILDRIEGNILFFIVSQIEEVF